MKKILILCLLLCISSASSAETITMKSGRVIEGEIVEQTHSSVKVDTGESVLNVPFRMMEPELAATLKKRGPMSKPVEKKESLPPVEREIKNVPIPTGEGFIEKTGSEAEVSRETFPKDVFRDNPETLGNRASAEKNPYFKKGLEYYYEKRQNQEAVNSFKKALEIDPYDAEIYRHLGLAYYELHQDEEALKYLQQAVGLKPNFPEAYRELGLIYHEIGQKAERSKAFKKAQELYALAGDHKSAEEMGEYFLTSTAVNFLSHPVFLVVLYCLFCYPLQRIADKTNTENSWLAYVPIVNGFYLFSIARLPIFPYVGGLFLLVIVAVIIPPLALVAKLIQLGVWAVIWVRITDECGKPIWLGFLGLVPGINLVYIWYLAFSKKPDVQMLG